MKENKPLNYVAKSVVKMLNNVLKIDANSTSCVVVYQPKVPKKLEKFRKEK